MHLIKFQSKLILQSGAHKLDSVKNTHILRNLQKLGFTYYLFLFLLQLRTKKLTIQKVRIFLIIILSFFSFSSVINTKQSNKL